MSGKQGVERGAAEDRSETPLTQTEARASRRPPGEGEQPIDRREQRRADQGDIEGDEEAQRRAAGR